MISGKDNGLGSELIDSGGTVSDPHNLIVGGSVIRLEIGGEALKKVGGRLRKIIKFEPIRDEKLLRVS